MSYDIKSLRTLAKNFKTALLSEEKRRILWVPVLFGIGTSFYFSIKFEPDIKNISYFFAGLFIFFVVTIWKNRILTLPVLALTIACAGFLNASLHASWLKSPVLEDNLGTIWVRATIEDIEKRTYGSRALLKDLDLWRPDVKKFKKEKTPKKARVNIRTNLGEAKPGDRVSFRAILSPPPPKPAYPRSYDFARFAYFEQIGAVGYSVSDIKIMESSTSGLISKLRYNITNRILDDFGDSDTGHIATALLTGQKGGISDKTMEDMRQSGLGHLLAISGLHMALVMATCFFMIRAFLALIPYIVLRYNIKKMAAMAALAVGFFYLLITGMPVSARRAYIMAGLFFITILLDRTGTPMRPIAWAALIVMFFDPLAITGPSFQMSFAAATALIAAYEKFSLLNMEKTITGSFVRRLKIYIIGLLFSSLVAGMATSPFAVYHFGRFANYGLMANFVAIPLTSFWVLPLGVLAFILMPFGLENIALVPMGWGIDIIKEHSSFINNIPHASIMLADMSPLAIGIITLSGLWFCIWQSWIRYISLLPVLIGILMIIFPNSQPDIIIDEKGKLFAVKSEKGELVFSSLVSARYSREQWLKVAGQEDSTSMEKNPPSNLSCKDNVCFYDAENYTVMFIKKNGQPVSCEADIIINLTENDSSCSNIETSQKTLYKITLADLHKNGTYVIWLGNPVKVESVESERGNRLWNSP